MNLGLPPRRRGWCWTGDCLDDLACYAQPEVAGPVASDPVVSPAGRGGGCFGYNSQ